MTETSFANMSLREPTKFRINTKYFSPHDLSLFVESLETITRLTREKRERIERKKINKLCGLTKRFETLPRVQAATDSDFSSSEATHEAAVGNVQSLENEKQPMTPESGKSSECDENYFSAPSSSQSTPRQKQFCECSTKSNYSLLSATDSEESGIYPLASTQHIIYETPVKPKTAEMTSKGSTPSKKSGLLSLMWKKESSKAAAVKLVSSRALDEYETLEIYKQQQEQQEMMQAEVQQKPLKPSRFATLHLKKLSARQEYTVSAGSAEERFFDKALRYLTL